MTRFFKPDDHENERFNRELDEAASAALRAADARRVIEEEEELDEEIESSRASSREFLVAEGVIDSSNE